MDLQTDNPEKGQLLQRSAQHRELLEEEMKAITEKSEKVITNALIIGGALALTYLLVSNFGSSKKKKAKGSKSKLVTDADAEHDQVEFDEPREAGVIAQIGSVLMAQATGLLLSIAREKLMEFLQSQAAKKHDTHEHS